MKKIYVLFAALLGLFFTTNTFAQAGFDNLEAVSRDGFTVDGDNPLITDAWEQMYGEKGELNPCTDLGEGSEWALLGESCPDEVLNPDEESGMAKRNSNDFWHSNWHNGDQPAGSHYLQVKMTDTLDPETLIAFVFQRRPADNDHTTIWLVMGTNDPEASKEECEEIVEVETPFSNNTEVLMSVPFERGEWQYLRFYSEEQKGASYGSRGYFHMSRFNIFPVEKMDEVVQAWNEVDKVYDQYDDYYFYYDGRTGTEPGDFSEEAVNAFIAALDSYSDLPNSATVEQLMEWKDNLIASYNAIAATKVPFTAKNLPTGYYRIKGAMMYTNDGEEVEKYMCGYRADGKLWAIWATPDLELDEDNIQALWKVTAVTDTTWDIQSMYHDARFTEVVRSTNNEMSTESDSLMAIDAAAYNHDDDLAYVNIRIASQPANDYYYLHMGGHNNGAGVSGYILGWSTTFNFNEGTPGASEWYFEEVSEEEALEIISKFNKDDAVKQDEFRSMLSKAPGMLEIAKDVNVVYEEDRAVVSDENPITSPCSDSAEGQHIEYLWDGKTDNFWHSDWHGEYTNEDHHYIQVAMPTENPIEEAVFKFTRRNTTSGNQINMWSVYGTNENDFELTQADLELLAEITTPYHGGNNTETHVSAPFKVNGYQYLRFYCEGTCNNDGTQGGNSKFMHMAEFQVYPGHINDSPTSQYKVMGDIAKNLEALVEEFEDYNYENFDVADYERLKPVYDAFVKIYVDPADLRAAIAANKNKGDEVVVGTDPGFWASSSSKDALNKTIADAEAYDKAGAYTPEKSENFIKTMEEQVAAIDAGPNKIKEGKWYRFRFGTEEEYDKYGFTKTGNTTSYIINPDDEEDTLGIDNDALFGKYVAVAKRVNIYDEFDDEQVIEHRVVSIPKDEIMLDKSIHAITLSELEDKDMALWRFVSIDDSTYAIQNKATGLYIHHDVYLSVQPGRFTQHPSGFGQNAFFNKTIQDKDKSPLHLAWANNVLSAWGNNTGSGWTNADGRRGSFYVEEVEDVAADYAPATEFQMSLTPGDIYGRCFPVPVTLKSTDAAQLWTVAKLERTPGDGSANEDVKVTFAKIDANVPAGRPFFIVVNGEMPESGEEYDPVIVKFGYTFKLDTVPQTENYLKGTFDSVTIPERFLTTGTGKGDESLTWKAADQSVSANRVYVTDIAEDAEAFRRKAVLEIVFDETLEDGINTVLKNVARQGGIYTIDGRFVGNGNINTVSKLAKGAYIINGTKVIVK